jgi:hypothetical protein
MTAKIINIRNTECPNCPEIKPVTDIEADLAFIDLVTELFQKAIKSENHGLAFQIVDQLLVSANALGQYTMHKTHL